MTIPQSAKRMAQGERTVTLCALRRALCEHTRNLYPVKFTEGDSEANFTGAQHATRNAEH